MSLKDWFRIGTKKDNAVTPPGKKYELVQDGAHSITLERPRGEITAYRIRALRDFGAVKAGDLGGFVESEKNLSHSGECWVYDDGFVHGNASISGDAVVANRAEVRGDAQVSEKAFVGGQALVISYARIHGCARVLGKARVCGSAEVFGDAELSDEASAVGSDRVHGRTRIYATGGVSGSASVPGSVCHRGECPKQR